MTSLFFTVLNLSLVGSVTAAVILAIRWVLKGRAPRWICYALWAVVLVRLLVPVSFSAPVSLFSLLPSHSADTVGESGRFSRLDVTGTLSWQTAPALDPATDGADRNQEQQIPADEGAEDPTAHGADSSQTAQQARKGIGWRTVAAAVWACGAAGLGGFLILHYLLSAIRLRRLRILPENDKIRRAGQLLPLRRTVRVCASRMFATPVVFGLLRPRIVLPRGFDWEDAAAQHILLHERVHIRRWDNLVKIAAAAVVCIHWFNPLVWLCFRLSVDDMEASCDERVLKILGEDSRKDYARSLLSMAQTQNRRLGAAPFLAFGESSLKQRVANILHYHKKTLISVLAALMAALLVGCSLLANPSSEPGQQTSGTKEQPQNSSSQTESLPEETQEPGIAVKDPNNMTLYVFYQNMPGWGSDEGTEPFYFPLPRQGVDQITPSWLQQQLLDQLQQSLPIREITVEDGTAVVSLQDNSEVQFARENGNGERYLSSVAMTLLQNCAVDAVRFEVEGEPYPSQEQAQAYTPAPLALPPVSQEEILALYDTVTLEQLQENLAAAGEDVGAAEQNPIDRWDLQGDQTAKEILDTIWEATIWNNLPEREFDSIAQAPNAFLLNAAYFQSPYVFWYEDGTEPNSRMDFSILTPLVNDFQCIPQQILEQTARQMFGDTVQITHEKPTYGYYQEYAMAYTPRHMGGWYPDIFLLDYTEQGDTVEATVAYGRLYGSAGNAMKTLTDMEEEQSIRTREQRHRFTLEKTEDGYRITGYHLVDTIRDMVSRAPGYYAYTAICGGLAFFDWDGVQSLTPDQLYGWMIAGYSPGLNDTTLPADTVENYFYAYTGYHLEDPAILRQSQYYDAQAGNYRIQEIEGVIGEQDFQRKYWCDYGDVTYQDENTALVPVQVYADEQRTQLLADGVMKMKYQEDPIDPWIADGFTSN